MNLNIHCYLLKFTEEINEGVRNLLKKNFPPETEQGINVNVIIYNTLPKIFGHPLFSNAQLIENICSGMLNPGYVKGSITTARKEGGILLQFEIDSTSNSTSNLNLRSRGYLRSDRDNDRDNDNVRERERDRVRVRDRMNIQQKQNVAFATLYNVTESDGGKYLYLSSLCALTTTMYRGIGARVVDFQKDFVNARTDYAGATLDALLYCRKADSGQNIRELAVGQCNEWLHDYYINRGFELRHTDVIHDVLEYEIEENQTTHKKIFKKNIKQGGAPFVFDTNKIIPMIYHK
jgi:hypothetical protein